MGCIAFVLSVVLLFFALVISAFEESGQEEAPFAVTSVAVATVAVTAEAETIPGLIVVDVPSAAHSDGHVDYPQNPPAGGPHHPVPQQCGFYDQPVGNEHAVHSQEHGAVWITYQPDLSADQIELLRALAATNDHILVSPYPDLPAPVVASAWGYQLQLEGADDPRLEQFLALFLNNGPEFGAACAGTTETIPMASPVAGSPVAATLAS